MMMREEEVRSHTYIITTCHPLVLLHMPPDTIQAVITTFPAEKVSD